MAADEYTRETERKIIRELQDENRVLRNLLRKKGITPPESRAFQAAFRDESAYDPDQGGRIIFLWVLGCPEHEVRSESLRAIDAGRLSGWRVQSTKAAA